MKKKLLLPGLLLMASASFAESPTLQALLAQDVFKGQYDQLSTDEKISLDTFLEEVDIFTNDVRQEAESKATRYKDTIKTLKLLLGAETLSVNIVFGTENCTQSSQEDDIIVE